VRALPSSSRPLAGLLERLRGHRAAFSLLETAHSARPYLLAGVMRALGSQTCIVVPTPDIAERTFADLTYYLSGTDIILVRPREESVGVIESPSERSARMALLGDLCAKKTLIAIVPVAALRQYVIPPEAFAALTMTLRPGDEPGFEE